MNITTQFNTILLENYSSSCTENYGNGEKIGMITKLSQHGVIWKSWEGHLNVTQTGMNSSGEPFDFSIDNDNQPLNVLATLDSAANKGWKVKLTYHETFGKNWFANRGSTDNFVTNVEVLSKNPMQNIFGNQQNTSSITSGHVIDTIYVVIVPKK